MKRDDRAQWEKDDEEVETAFKLTRADRALLQGGLAAAVQSGTVAGLVMGFGPWLLTLLLRAALGGGWRFDHWVVNLTLYAVIALLLGPAMGALRYWSNLGHRFSTVPVAGVRAGWHTWLGLTAIDVMVVVFTMEDQLGVLLLFAIFGLIWLGLLYDLLWTFVQNRLIGNGLFTKPQ